MKKYTVILTSTVNMMRDVEEDRPETKEYWFDIEADNESDALSIAKDKHPLSVWDSEVYEN